MSEAEQPEGTRAFLNAFRSRRVGSMIPLGFASGLPAPLIGGTLTAWMATEGVDLTTIGIFSLVSLPFSFKFVWAPLLDRFTIPFLGRRRGWMIVAQLALVLGIAALGWVNPASAPVMLAFGAIVVATLSASQDIVSDAYRTDALRAEERASGTAVFVAAYRGALIVSSAGALILSDFLPWRTVYLIMGLMMGVGIVGTLFAPAPELPAEPPPSFAAAVIEPFREFFTRKRALTLLGIVLFYKVGDVVAAHLRTPFLMEVGFSRTEIGAIVKGLGLGATIIGALVGGGLVATLGLWRSLLLFGVLQSTANIFYAVIGMVAKSYPLLVVAIGVDNLFGGFATAAFVALLMSLCDKRYTATQYALLTSAASIVGKLLGAGSGVTAKALGWPGFFLLTVIVAIPALGLLYLARDTLKETSPEPVNVE